MNNVVTIKAYNPQWPKYFSDEAELIQKILGDNLITIYHIGSTSIAGMSAKPIIDMIPVVEDIIKVDDVADSFVRLGYEAKGEGGMLFRRFFTKNDPELGFNIHVYPEGSGEIARLVKFRDWLCEHPADAQAYLDLKTQLAESFSEHRLKYTMGKEAFIAAIDKQTGYDGIRIVHALTDREWAAYHAIRLENSLSNEAVVNDNEQIHLMLHKGSDIVAFADLEFTGENGVIMHQLAAKNEFNNTGIKEIFSAEIKKWLKQQGRIKS